MKPITLESVIYERYDSEEDLKNSEEKKRVNLLYGLYILCCCCFYWLYVNSFFMRYRLVIFNFIIYS